jgi:hypothetical protein
MNNEVGSIWKETVLDYLRYYPIFFLEKFRDNKKNLSQDSAVPSEIRTV